MKRRGIKVKWVIILAAAVLCVAFLYEQEHDRSDDPTINALAENIGNFDEDSAVMLDMVAPFEWEHVYLAGEGAQPQQLGLPEDAFDELEEDSMIFWRDGQAVEILPLWVDGELGYCIDLNGLAALAQQSYCLSPDSDVQFKKTGKATLLLQTDLTAFAVG